MPTEQKPAEQKNKPRRWEWVFRLALLAAGGGVYAGYDQFIKDKPLYDTFQTKSEASYVSQQVTAIAEKQDRQLEAINDVKTALGSLKTAIDERQANAVEIQNRHEASIQKNTLDIANLKFIVQGKTN